MIERKAQGKEIAVQPEPEEVTEPAPDLMGALKASLEAVRAREGEEPGAKAAKPKAAKKKAAKATAAKKAPAKKSAGKPSASKRATAKR
jgi:non-homologous end joining protein Ku